MISTCGSVWKAAKRPFRKPWCRGQKEVVMYCLLLVTGLSLLLTHAFSQMPMVTIKSNGWFEMKANLILIASDGRQEQAAMTGSCCCDRWPDTSAAHLPQWKHPQAQFCWVAGQSASHEAPRQGILLLLPARTQLYSLPCTLRILSELRDVLVSIWSKNCFGE